MINHEWTRIAESCWLFDIPQSSDTGPPSAAQKLTAKEAASQLAFLL